MWIDRAVKWLLPREDHFFDLLERGADKAVEAGEALVATCAPGISLTERTAQVQRLRDIEHAADDVIREVYEALNKTFVTPIDRSDIYALATELENVVDRMTSTAAHILVHSMEDLPAGTEELTRIIADGSVHVRDAVRMLRSLKQMQEIRVHCVAVHKAEHDGDQVFRQQIGAMFRDYKDAIHLIKHKEFLEGLEYTLDVLDDVACAIENIVIKNA